jgi:hypothetical protein
MLNKKSISNLEDSSDSEQSIFEVPVPPKPKPLLIDLQDSEEEDNTNLEINNSKNRENKNASNDAEVLVVTHNSNIAKTSKKCKDTFSKNGKNHKSVPNKNSIHRTNLDKRLQATQDTQQIEQDIILNCTTIQKGAKDINEIRQLSKNVEVNKNQSNAGINQNSNSESQNMLEANDTNNINLHEETSATLSTKSQKLRKMQQDIDINIKHTNYLEPVNQGTSDTRIESLCSNSNINRKRQYDNENRNNSEIKRQCIVQQSDQNVVPQCSTNTNEKERNESSGEHFFNPMPERLRNRYYSVRDQENLSVAEMQRGMSKDPRMWAILNEDITPNYFGKKHHIKCRNCNQDGHHRKNCPIPFKLCCYMCGTQGHTESRCPWKCCLTCGKQQSTFRKTCEYCRVLYCTMCNSIGHKMQQCPDLWRRYHQTTSMDNVPQNPGNVMKSPNLLHCCNCTKRGHEPFMCRQYRWSQHFFTPAAVLDYVNGPMYTMNSSETNIETNVLTSKVTGYKTLILQSPKNTQQARREYVDSSINIKASCVNKTPTPQKLAYTQETERYNLYSKKIVDISSLKHNQDQTEKRSKELDFVKIVYKCGQLKKDKKDNNNSLISKKLSECHLIKTYFTKERRRRTIKNLLTHKIVPVFLEKLNKNVEFEMTIGYVHNCNELMIQVIASHSYGEYIIQLFFHWFRIPDDEKDYGVDVNLPNDANQIYNLLKTKQSQLEEVCPISYDKCTENNENNARWLDGQIKRQKSKLERYSDLKKEDKVYQDLYRTLWRLQLKLLMIVNIEFKINNYIASFQKVFNHLCHIKKTSGKIKLQFYLEIILLYNHLFVPHTSCYVHRMLLALKKQEKLRKSNNNPSQQKFETSHEEEKKKRCAWRTNKNISSFETSYTMQDTASAENSMFIQQRADNDISNEENYVSFGTDDITNNEVILIDDSNIQDSQTTSTLVTEPMPVQSEYTEKNETQSSRSDVNNGNNINEKNTKQMQESKINYKKKERSKRCSNELFSPLEEKDRNKALKWIQKAHTFPLPHMIDAAEKLQKRINNNTAKKKHLIVLEKLMKLEKQYQKNVSNYCNYL